MNGATTRVAFQPATGSSISAHTSAATPSTRLSAPSRSGIPARASSPTGTLTKKIHRQDNSTSKPPMGGPSAAAIAPAADHVLTATARRAAGTAAINSASELGISIAAPTA
jgi:hypothetical protein